MSSIGSDNAQNLSVRTCNTTGLKWATTKASTGLRKSTSTESESKLLLAKRLAKTYKGHTRTYKGHTRRQIASCVLGNFCQNLLSLQQGFVAATSRTNWFDFLRLVAAKKSLKLSKRN